jgi:hypothetical protein
MRTSPAVPATARALAQHTLAKMSAPLSPIPFVVGRHYTRADIFDLLGIHPHPTGGNWFTGYNRHGDDWYVFTHIQAAGRTGHDYHNVWEGSLLRWRGKTGSRVGHESIQAMLAPRSRIFVFTRDQNQAPFTFQGLGRAARCDDTVPVTVWWRFSDPGAAAENDPSSAEPVGVDDTAGHGAGFGWHEDNLAVERAAVEYVTAYYHREGWDVTSVESERVGYDLRCLRGGDERHVEVKGVAGEVASFMLTDGERRRAGTDPLWRVAVVTKALGPAPRYLEVPGAELLGNWELIPVTWRASPRARP